MNVEKWVTLLKIAPKNGEERDLVWAKADLLDRIIKLGVNYLRIQTGHVQCVETLIGIGGNIATNVPHQNQRANHKRSVQVEEAVTMKLTKKLV